MPRSIITPVDHSLMPRSDSHACSTKSPSFNLTWTCSMLLHSVSIEDRLTHHDAARAEEDVENERGAEEKKDTATEQQGSDGDPNKERDIEEISGKEEESKGIRGEDTTLA
ncbi:hypothetical protein NDU88_001662 [Pleurodeles waltl]|uniref:Uncharacterized protein n=1 Tax=Pleurodeles waltl TaxID=8319 RepID=A0AAV7Q4H7_PLEWA|nr:hypothetical protein NDU88_001662 [Pleurodeles waltl]